MGCPPPVISPPEEVDPCTMGFEVGKSIATTIANIIVPTLLEESDLNPLTEDPTYIELKELQDQVKNGEITDLNEQNIALVEKFSELSRKLVDDKVKCFEEKVIPVEKVDINVVCVSQGGHKSVAEALQNSNINYINCGHVDCEGIQDQLEQEGVMTSDTHHVGIFDGEVGNFENISNGVVALEGVINNFDSDAVNHVYDPDVEDAYGNIHTPVSG